MNVIITKGISLFFNTLIPAPTLLPMIQSAGWESQMLMMKLGFGGSQGSGAHRFQLRNFRALVMCWMKRY